MRGWRTISVLLLILVLASVTACNPFGGDEKEVSQQLVEVVRGDLTITVSGSGNLEISNEIRLTFGVGGRIEKLYVEESDEVIEGEVLAKLETDALELALAQAEAARIQVQVALAQAELAQIQAKAAKAQAQIALAQVEAGYAQAQAGYAQAQAGQAQAQIALAAAEDEMDDAEDLLKRLKKFLPKTDHRVEDAQLRFDAAELQIEAAQAQIEAAQAQIEAADLQFEIVASQLDAADLQFEIVASQLAAANAQFELTQEQLAVSELAIAEAQRQLDKATLTAPFDGIVASVDVDEGDTVSPAIPVIHLIDPSSMQLKVQVDEIDVAEVKLEQRAIIEVDALPSLSLEGKVDSISLLPTHEAGVIVYDVEIEFDISRGIGLRVGMSATADIVIAERKDVLLVPDRAITQDSPGNSIVEVMVDEQIEERTVVTGISDGFQTEILDGLEEREMVKRRAGSN